MVIEPKYLAMKVCSMCIHNKISTLDLKSDKMSSLTHALIAIPNNILIPTDSRTRKSHNQTFRHITQKDTYSTLQAQALV
jgi:hypothetical protein